MAVKDAIDRIKISAEEEVRAESFYGKDISCSKTRFFCPECGEQVFWRSRWGARPDVFYHKAKTNATPECDKRVDGRSDLYLYERVGLSLALQQLGHSQFRLNIIFPALGEQLLSACIAHKASVSITGTKKGYTIPINSTYFLAEQSTLIPVSYVPMHGSNYDIQVNAGYSVKKRWSNYADGFSSKGAIFSHSESGGKKIRRGDTISPGRNYYVIAKEFSSPYDEVRVSYAGSVPLNDSTYSVYVIKIDVSTDDESRYLAISRYFKNLFDIWLLELAPEFVPLWPPMIEQDTLVPTGKSGFSYLSILSGNMKPKVYTYTRNTATPWTVLSGANGENTIKIPSSYSEMIISVDRKYTGREIVIRNRPLEVSNYQYNFSLELKNGKIINLNNFKAEDLNGDMLCRSNAKFELLIGSRNGCYFHLPIRSSETIIPNQQGTETIIFATEGGIIAKHFSCTAATPFVDTKSIMAQLTRCFVGSYVPLPRWVGGLLLDLQQKGEDCLVGVIRKGIINGKISKRMLDILASLYKSSDIGDL